MKTVQSILQKLLFKENSVPVALLVTCTLAFGLLIPNLGYYMDDWPYVFYAYNKGIASLSEMLLYDNRRAATWLYTSAFWLLGFKPLHWHIAMLLLRWITVVLMWTTLRRIWPGRTREITYLAFLFSVYPFFLLQPAAVGSTHHWVGFALLNLSLWLMAFAFSNRKFFFAATAASVLLTAAHLFTSEYFAGLELLRPIILWILIARIEHKKSKAIRSLLLNWLPYVLTLAAFTFWRGFIYESPTDVTRNALVIPSLFLSEPLKAVWFILNASIKDAFSVLTMGWQNATNVNLIDLDSIFGRYRLLVSAIAFSLIYFFLSRVSFTTHSTETEDDWKTKGTILALTGLLLAGLPIWLIGRTIVESRNLVSASRFGLPTMFGASFVLILLMQYLINDKKKTVLALTILLALAINFHLDNTNGFQYSWKKQIRLYRELSWRAPEIEPGTAIVTDMEILGYMGSYATSFGINTSYQPVDIHSPKYWYFPVYYTFDFDAFVNGMPIQGGRLTSRFSGNSADSLVISFDPELDRCLWVLRPEDDNLRLISDDMRRLSAVSAIERIGDNNGIERVLPEEIFGRQVSKGWCYYFEKADLARQYGHWSEVVNLYEQGQADGEQAGNGFEQIPFIEGYGHMENWKMVQSLTKATHKITKGLEPNLCDSLDGLRTNAPPSAERDETIKDLKEYLHCTEFQ